MLDSAVRGSEGFSPDSATGFSSSRSLCISSPPTTYLLYFLETRPIQQEQGCISNTLETPNRVCFSTFQFNWESLEECSNGPGPNLTNNSNMAESVLTFQSSSNVSKESNFDTLSRTSFSGPKDEKGSINREGKINTSGLEISGKMY